MTDENLLARLLISLAFRGAEGLEAWRILEGSQAASSVPGKTTSFSQRSRSIRAAVRSALRPLTRVPVVAGLRQRVNRVVPGRENGLIKSAAVLAHSGLFDEALRLLERAARINPRNPAIEPHLSRIRFMIARSIDPEVPQQTRAMVDTLESMNRELSKKALYVPGEFWSTIGKFHVDLLKTYGIETFKRTVSHHYQNWLMISLGDPQVRRLLETWAGHRKLEPFVNEMEHPDHVGFHLSLNFNEAEYPLAREPDREIYRLAVGLLWEHVLEGDPQRTLESLEELEVGNPIRIRRHGRLISSDLAHSVRERALLLNHLNLIGREGLVVGELGAGHGRLAEIFGRTTNYRYFIFDVTPALFVSQWYIRRVFPHEKIFTFRPFNDWSEVRDEVSVSRFAFFTANQIELVPNNSLDLFINMNSLMEMKKEQIQNFLSQISRLTTTAFLSRQWLRWRNDLDNLTTEKDDFILTDGWRKGLDCIDDVYPDFFNQIWERK